MEEIVVEGSDLIFGAILVLAVGAAITKRVDVLLMVFFTTIGTSAKFSQLKAGGKALAILVACAGIFLVVQNGTGVLLAKLFGVHPGYGLFSGSVSLAGGFCGLGMGATPVAIANMNAITAKHGASFKAFLTIPLVGAFFIDLLNAMVIKFFIEDPLEVALQQQVLRFGGQLGQQRLVQLVRLQVRCLGFRSEARKVQHPNALVRKQETAEST